MPGPDRTASYPSRSSIADGSGADTFKLRNLEVFEAAREQRNMKFADKRDGRARPESVPHDAVHGAAPQQRSH
jgi:hypothetical protein